MRDLGFEEGIEAMDPRIESIAELRIEKICFREDLRTYEGMIPAIAMNSTAES